MKYLIIIARIVTGAVFVFSGFVKGVDPFGSMYKFSDYLTAFDLNSLQGLTLPAAYILCTVEFITGIMILTGIRIRTGIYLAAIMMAFFTPLTFVLALNNPVSDCGCFGDAIHLTNWQTFYKNLVVSSFVVLLFLERKAFRPVAGAVTEWIVTSLIAILFSCFILYNQLFLPVIDFLPYKTGNSIPELMKIPEGSEPDKYETTFIYEKNGERKEFSLENYPANDTTWKFIDASSVLVKKGYTPPIHGFSITDANGNQITDSLLYSKKPVFLLVSRKIENVPFQRLETGIACSSMLRENGAEFYILTSSGTSAANSFSGVNVGFVDETVIKSMVRSNPGFMLLKNGKIIKKWSWLGLPDCKEIESLIKQ